MSNNIIDAVTQAVNSLVSALKTARRIRESQ